MNENDKSRGKGKARLGGFFIKFLSQPLIHESLDPHAALSRLFFYLSQQFELDGDCANHFEFGVRCVGIKLREVVAIPELANLLV